MTDITMCMQGCDKQDECYRWTAEADYCQNYADYRPINGDCDYFQSNKGKWNIKSRPKIQVPIKEVVDY